MKRTTQAERTSKRAPLTSVPRLLVNTRIAHSWQICPMRSQLPCSSWITSSCSRSTRSLSSFVRFSSADAVMRPSGTITSTIAHRPSPAPCPRPSLLPYCRFQLLPDAALAALANCSASPNTSSVREAVSSRVLSLSLRQSGARSSSSFSGEFILRRWAEQSFSAPHSSPSLRLQESSRPIRSNSTNACVRSPTSDRTRKFSRVRARQLRRSGSSLRARWVALDSQRELTSRKRNSWPPKSRTFTAPTRSALNRTRPSPSRTPNSRIEYSLNALRFSYRSCSYSSSFCVRSSGSSSCSPSSTTKFSSSVNPKSPARLCRRKWSRKSWRSGMEVRQSSTRTASTSPSASTTPVFPFTLAFPITSHTSSTRLKPSPSSCGSERRSGLSSTSLSAQWRKCALRPRASSRDACWESGLMMACSLGMRTATHILLFDSTRTPVSALYWKSGLTSTFSCRSFRESSSSVVVSPSLSMESLRWSISSLDSSRISSRTCVTCAMMPCISCLWWRRKARLAAWRWRVRGSRVTVLMRFSSSMTLFFLALSNLNARDSLPPDSTFSPITHHTLSASFSTSLKNYNFRYKRRFPLGSEGGLLYSRARVSRPASRMRCVSRMPGYFSVRGYCCVRSWLRNWARRRSSGLTRPSASASTLSCCSPPRFWKQTARRQTESSSIRSSTSPANTSTTRSRPAFSFPVRDRLPNSCSISSSFADRLRLKLCRESTTPTSRFAISTNEISAGSSTLNLALGRQTRVRRRVSGRPSRRWSLRVCSRRRRSRTRMGLTSSCTRESTTPSSPALTSPTARLNYFPTCCHSESWISAQSPRSVSPQKQCLLKLSESRIFFSTSSIRFCLLLSPCASRQKQQTSPTRTRSSSRCSLASASSSSMPLKRYWDSKRSRGRSEGRGSLSSCGAWRLMRSCRRRQRKTGQTMLSTSFQISKFTITATSRISTRSALLSPLKDTSSPAPSPTCAPLGMKAQLRTPSACTSGSCPSLRRKSSSRQQCWSLPLRKASRSGWRVKQSWLALVWQQVAESSSQNSSLTEKWNDCWFFSRTSCSRATRSRTSCRLLPELNEQDTPRTDTRKCEHPRLSLSRSPSPSAAHRRSNAAAVTYFGKLACRWSRTKLTRISCLKLMSFHSSPSSRLPLLRSWATAFWLNSAAACSISGACIMLFSSPISAEGGCRGSEMLIIMIELKKSWLADLPLLSLRLSPSGCCARPSSAITERRMR